MTKQPPDLSHVATVGVDVGKHVFCVHAVDAEGQPVLTRTLGRDDLKTFFASLRPCQVGIEACSSSHHWGRELQALGHDVRLMNPAYVKPYVKRDKNDAVDAAAICEAVTRPSMRFVKVRSIATQASLMHHKVRELLVGQRTRLLNALHGHLIEIGIVVERGQGQLLATLVRDGRADLPEVVRSALLPMIGQLDHLDQAVKEADAAIARLAKADDVASRLMTIPGIGALTATALTAAIGDPAYFSSSRAFSSYLGLVPREHSSGGKVRLGRISKAGNRYLRKLLVICAFSVLRQRSCHTDSLHRWADRLMASKPYKVAAVAVANKLARIAIAIMNSNQRYRAAEA